MSTEKLENIGSTNIVEVGKKVTVQGRITGNNNRVIITDSVHDSVLNITINGDNNSIVISRPFYIKSFTIRCGNHMKAHNTALNIAENVSIEPSGQLLLYNSGNRCEIGRDCLFSNNLTIRCGESPHLVFDKTTGEYLDISEGVFIGDHVWIGERVYITKRVTIPKESVVAACSVVTRRFDLFNTVIAGNPAKVVRENVQWIRNTVHLEKDSIYEIKHAEFASRFPKK